jgi:hypothetical protein
MPMSHPFGCLSQTTRRASGPLSLSVFRMADLAIGRWLQRMWVAGIDFCEKGVGALRGQAIDFCQQGHDGGVDLLVRAAVS